MILKHPAQKTLLPVFKAIKRKPKKPRGEIVRGFCFNICVNPRVMRVKRRKKPCCEITARHFTGAGDGTRTRDLRITNALLYQLSYASINLFERKKTLAKSAVMCYT